MTTTETHEISVTRTHVQVVYGDSSGVYRYGRPGSRYAMRVPLTQLTAIAPPSGYWAVEWHVVVPIGSGGWRSVDEDCYGSTSLWTELWPLVLAERDCVLERNDRIFATGPQLEAAQSRSVTVRILDAQDGRFALEVTKTSKWEGDPPTETTIGEETFGSLHAARRAASALIPWGGL